MSTTTVSSLVFIIVLLCIFQVDCYGSGAPMSTCPHANVIHRSRSSNYTEFYEPQAASTNPFVFHHVAEKYRPRHTLRVTISGRNGELFKGFFLQARAVGSSAPLGTFSDLPALTQIRQCSDGADDSVTHTSKDEKEALSFLWTAPPQGAGDIVFVGSVALGHSTFYVNMTSAIIEEDTSPCSTCGAGITQVNLFATMIGLIVAMVYTSSE